MKRHLISALVTFVTAFCLYFVTVIDTVTIESFRDGSLVSLAFVATRAGIKGLMEYFLVVTATK
jgi:hypothetical protein